MRHQVKGRKLNRTSSHKDALMRNLATSLFEHKRLYTTEAKAKELRPYAEKLISRAKHALIREKQGLLTEGQSVDIHNRRMVGRHIRNKAVLQELFDTIAPMVEERPGGYTRIVKVGFRRGDAARTAIIELVDWSAPQDGAVSNKPRKKAKAKKAKTKQTLKSPTAVANAEAIKEVVETIEDKLENVAVDNNAAQVEEVAHEVETSQVEEVAEVKAEEIKTEDAPKDGESAEASENEEKKD